MSPRAKKPRPIEDVIADAWKIRDELDAAATRLAGQAARNGDERVLAALEIVTAMLYFGERHKWEGMLGALLEKLDPHVARLFEERGATAAYDAVHEEEA